VAVLRQAELQLGRDAATPGVVPGEHVPLDVDEAASAVGFEGFPASVEDPLGVTEGPPFQLHLPVAVRRGEAVVVPLALANLDLAPGLGGKLPADTHQVV